MYHVYVPLEVGTLLLACLSIHASSHKKVYNGYPCVGSFFTKFALIQKYTKETFIFETIVGKIKFSWWSKLRFLQQTQFSLWFHWKFSPLWHTHISSFKGTVPKLNKASYSEDPDQTAWMSVGWPSSLFTQKILSKTCSMPHFQILLVFDLGPNCLQRLSADDKSRLAKKQLIRFFVIWLERILSPDWPNLFS